MSFWYKNKSFYSAIKIHAIFINVLHHIWWFSKIIYQAPSGPKSIGVGSKDNIFNNFYYWGPKIKL